MSDHMRAVSSCCRSCWLCRIRQHSIKGRVQGLHHRRHSHCSYHMTRCSMLLRGVQQTLSRAAVMEAHDALRPSPPQCGLASRVGVVPQLLQVHLWQHTALSAHNCWRALHPPM